MSAVFGRPLETLALADVLLVLSALALSSTSARCQSVRLCSQPHAHANAAKGKSETARLALRAFGFELAGACPRTKDARVGGSWEDSSPQRVPTERQRGVTRPFLFFVTAVVRGSLLLCTSNLFLCFRFFEVTSCTRDWNSKLLGSSVSGTQRQRSPLPYVVWAEQQGGAMCTMNPPLTVSPLQPTSKLRRHISITTQQSPHTFVAFAAARVEPLPSSLSLPQPFNTSLLHLFFLSSQLHVWNVVVALRLLRGPA